MPEEENEVEFSAPLVPQVEPSPPLTSMRIPPAPEPHQDDLEVTDPSDWNSPRKQGFMVRLPSGNVCRVKRLMDFADLARGGKIPNPLGAQVLRMIEEGSPTIDLHTLPPDSQLQAVLFIDEQVCRMMIEPRCYIPPETDADGQPVDAEQWVAPAGAISILDLTQDDRLFLFNVSQGGTTALTSFRDLQTRIVEAVEARQSVPRPTKRTNGGRGAKRTAKRAG